MIFLGRHGQGWHNVAESKYGTEAWDVSQVFWYKKVVPFSRLFQCYWSMLDGADGMVWADANLTALGQTQALDVHKLWKSQLPHRIPVPETFYVSPLSRAIETADLTFKALRLPEDKQYCPVVKEVNLLIQILTIWPNIRSSCARLSASTRVIDGRLLLSSRQCFHTSSSRTASRRTTSYGKQTFANQSWRAGTGWPSSSTTFLSMTTAHSSPLPPTPEPLGVS